MVYRREPPVYMGGEKLNTPAVEYGTRRATVASVGAIVAQLALAAQPGAPAAGGAGAPQQGPESADEGPGRG